MVPNRDDRIVDFYYPILSCFLKMISDPNPVLVEIILSVSENYPEVYCVAQHTFLCSVYFTLIGKITAGAILPSAEHNWLCCDRKSRAACAQSFALWQQATIEFTCHDHSIIACSPHVYVWRCSSRTSRLW